MVTATAALLWTDGRYFAQAVQELAGEWRLMKDQQPGVPTVEVEAEVRNTPHSKPFCSTHFGEFGAQLRTCRGSNSCRDVL